MEISNDLKAYHQLMDTFIAHWTAVNAALGGNPLVLPEGGPTLALFQAHKTALTSLYQAVESGDNQAQTGAADRDGLRDDLLTRLSQFRTTVTGLLPGSRYAQALPKTPPKTASQGVIVKALQDGLSVWEQIEADASVTLSKPLVLADSTTRASLTTGFASLQSAYSAIAAGKAAAAQARAERNVLLKALDKHMKQYPKTVKALLPKGHALLANLPSVSR